jgi:hypothetical protein
MKPRTVPIGYQSLVTILLALPLLYLSSVRRLKILRIYQMIFNDLYEVQDVGSVHDADLLPGEPSPIDNVPRTKSSRHA